ncbi:MAG: hypothetical protein COT74_10345 [Bdellovibrionales bacterium CG10_big_fil_rev_8_21_14_0_10_45_34]|nr:MAG: hypothetical protein COT74_10345 [Bdellovibrionales bacterium CG10_big_fil_rev_8_21_14_0_10_45_34]
MSIKQNVFQLISHIMSQHQVEVDFIDMSVTDHSEPIQKIIDSVARNQLARFLIIGNDLIIPCAKKGELIGIARVHDGANLDNLFTKRIQAMLQFACDSADLFDKADYEFTTIRELNPNEDCEEEDLDELTVSATSAILLEAHDLEKARRFAIDMHQNSKRIAFLPLADLSISSESGAEELRKLGNITLFISDLESLSVDIQNSLLTLLSDDLNNLEDPVIIAATAKPVAELMHSGKVDKELIELLSQSRIQLLNVIVNQNWKQPLAVMAREFTPAPNLHIVETKTIH